MGIYKNSLGVLLIDMQNYFLMDIEEGEKERLIQNQLKVIRFCEIYNIPIIVLEFSGYDTTIQVLSEAVRRVKINMTIEKPCSNGFSHTNLARKLDALSVDTLLLMGINASSCARHTGKGAVDAGFNIATSEDLIADPPDWNTKPAEIIWFQKNGTYRKEAASLLPLSQLDE